MIRLVKRWGSQLWHAIKRDLLWPEDRLLLAVLAVLVVAAGVGPHLTPATAQTSGSYRVVFVGDISPPTNETKGDDHATAELIAKLQPDLVCLTGDVQYETGSPAMFAAPTGFEGSHGRLVKSLVRCPAQGNHDATDGGNDGRAPGFSTYFADALTDLPCESEPVPCKPLDGYYVLDLDVDRDGELDWYVLVLNSNCGRAGGGTGDTASPSCASSSPMLNWMRSAIGSRHGGQTSGRKCGIVVDHHERWGTSFFADDPALDAPWQVGNHFHLDVWESGHSHSTGRTGPLTWNGVPATSGQRQITTGAGGRSLTPHRVNPSRVGTRYRDNTGYAVEMLTLSASQSPAGWQGGSWSHAFHRVDGSVVDQASAGCWP